jgi:prostaglandin reductase 1
MSTKQAKVWIYAREFKGNVELSNFELREEEVSAIEDGEFLAQALFLSVDPYLRTFQLQYSTDTVMTGRQIAR